MEFTSLFIPGLVLIKPKTAGDGRGIFVKTFHHDLYSSHGILFTPKEEFFSISHAGVLRGMHYQTPPAEHDKMVYCTAGCIHDVILDLRIGSPTYRQVWAGKLDATTREILLIPRGLAHGFLAAENNTVVHYSVSHVYDPDHDRGIRWDSFGYIWPAATSPILSQRDASLPPLDAISSPFRFQ